MGKDKSTSASASSKGDKGSPFSSGGNTPSSNSATYYDSDAMVEVQDVDPKGSTNIQPSRATSQKENVGRSTAGTGDTSEPVLKLRRSERQKAHGKGASEQGSSKTTLAIHEKLMVRRSDRIASYRRSEPAGNDGAATVPGDMSSLAASSRSSTSINHGRATPVIPDRSSADSSSSNMTIEPLKKSKHKGYLCYDESLTEVDVKENERLPTLTPGSPKPEYLEVIIHDRREAGKICRHTYHIKHTDSDWSEQEFSTKVNKWRNQIRLRATGFRKRAHHFYTEEQNYWLVVLFKKNRKIGPKEACRKFNKRFPQNKRDLGGFKSYLLKNERIRAARGKRSLTALRNEAMDNDDKMGLTKPVKKSQSTRKADDGDVETSESEIDEEEPGYSEDGNESEDEDEDDDEDGWSADATRRSNDSVDTTL